MEWSTEFGYSYYSCMEMYLEMLKFTLFAVVESAGVQTSCKVSGWVIVRLE